MASIPQDIFFATIGDISAKLRAREFSCVELARAYCDRLERLGPRYNALALSLREQAVKRARDVDGDIKRGRFRSAAGDPIRCERSTGLRGAPHHLGRETVR